MLSGARYGRDAGSRGVLAEEQITSHFKGLHLYRLYQPFLLAKLGANN